jgi:ABC-2 type transport system permease protein
MTRILVGKLFRDVRLPLAVVAILLIAFQCLWAKVAQRIVQVVHEAIKRLTVTDFVRLVQSIFEGPGKVMQTLMGGESIQITSINDMMTIGYVHPLVQTILCIWAVGRAAGALAGEIDRGTMELLLAQPLARSRVILAHLCLDLLAIPVLCLAIWGGTWLGTWAVGINDVVDPWTFGPALWNVAALLFAVSGYTMWLSAHGRFRGRVMGFAVLVTLLQFLVNVIGQMWDTMGPLRPYTVFYYYQPQQIILRNNWRVAVTLPWQDSYTVNGVAVLTAVGAIGYGLALWKFCRRDLPAPL